MYWCIDDSVRMPGKGGSRATGGGGVEGTGGCGVWMGV